MSETNEWTLMFFFAGDNSLSPSMISQLKAINDAGFQKNTTVVVRYDPNEKGARTRIFEVNRERKEKHKTRIGDGTDPFVRNLREDVVTWETVKKQMTKRGINSNLISKATLALLNESSGHSDATGAKDALCNFLSFCRDLYSANHYMLFLVGHGMIVGNDAFLPDDNPQSGITLQKLGEVLGEFNNRNKGALELVCMHSCSMSGIEVAYQLRGRANYMMATEGISFVSTWPYRQLLKKIFRTVNDAPNNEMKETDIKLLLRKLHYLTLHNSTDFMFAGFSADLCVCNLNETKVREFDEALRALTQGLKKLLQVECGRELILLTHWKSQSYWQENYIDLYDFCRCLSEKSVESFGACRCPDKKCDTDHRLRDAIKAVNTACGLVTTKLATAELDPEESPDSTSNLNRSFDKLVVFSDHFGPTYQYSRGLSIYFPWSSPIKDGLNDVLGKYEEYEFSKALGRNPEDSSQDESWLGFLEEYFKMTKRKSRDVEDGVKPEEPTEPPADFTIIGNVSGNLIGALEPKTTPRDSGGSACSCASIKNYPIEFSTSPGAKYEPREENNFQSE